MALVFVLPDLGEGVAEAEIVRWHVEEGATIREDEPLADVTTAKATVEVPSPRSGTILRILTAPGERVLVGTPLVIIGETGEQVEPLLSQDPSTATGSTPAPVPPSISRGASKVVALPRVRRLAQQLGVSLESLALGGPITEEAVRAAAAASGEVPSERRWSDDEVLFQRRLSGVRRVGAAHLTRAVKVPAVVVVEEAQLDELDRLRRLLSLSWLPFLIQACVAAIRHIPEANAVLEEGSDELVALKHVDMAIAVHTEEGLVVPVLRRSETLSLYELDERVQQLGRLAREGKLGLEESMGGSFTISSPAEHGALIATPILNVPQVALFALHRPSIRPLVRSGELTAGLAAHTSVTHDHRVIDGVTGSRLLKLINQRLSEPLQAFRDGAFVLGEAPSTAVAASTPASGAVVGELARTLDAAPASRRVELIEAFLEQSLGTLMRQGPAFDPERTWTELGVDSLTALALRERLSEGLGTALPVDILFAWSTPAALAEHLVGLELTVASASGAPKTGERPEQLLRRLLELPDAEARAILAERVPGWGGSKSS